MILPKDNSLDITPEQTRGSTLPFKSGESSRLPSVPSVPSVVNSAPLCDPAKYELTADMLAKARGIAPRNARAALSYCPVIRKESRGGRPFNVYDVSDDVKLAQTSERIAANLPACDVWELSKGGPGAPRAVSTDDLRVAQLRAQAVKDYLYWQSCGLSEREACLRVCAAWATPQTLEITTTLRAKRASLGGGYHERGRRVKKTISVGGFHERSLRKWAAIWRATEGDEQKKIVALCDQKRGNCGATATEIPDALRDLVYSLLTTSCRSDLKAALREARKQWKGNWPRTKRGNEVGYDTWRRRMYEIDPNWAGRTLGSQGIAQHQWKHTPDISVDRSGMGFNDEWTLDDVTQDWYAVNTIDNEVFRPRLYVLQRVATRQWICAVASIDAITADQVRAMVGTAMASAGGGIPKKITFENGAVACDETLFELLSTLNIKVRRTSMIGGSVIKGGAPDRATGNFAGKATVESAIKQLHRYFIFQPGQTGSNERTDAPARLQVLKKMAEDAAAAGTVLLFPTQDEMHGIVRTAINEFNDTPHGGLPEVAAINAESTIIRRSATPNEWAKKLNADKVRVLDAAMLPLFLSRGAVVNVSRNGIRINNEFYGRFDMDVQALRGRAVHVHSNPDDPSMIYVAELDRCVERFDMPKPDEDLTEFYRAKKTVARRDRNQLEMRYRNAIAAGGGVTLESLQFTNNPTPNRAFEKVAPEEFARRMSAQTAASRAVEQTREQRAEEQAARGSFTDRRLAKYEEAAVPA